MGKLGTFDDNSQNPPWGDDEKFSNCGEISN
jgi:hypothetical protein